MFKYKDKQAEEVTSLTKQIAENKIYQVNLYMYYNLFILDMCISNDKL